MHPSWWILTALLMFATYQIARLLQAYTPPTRTQTSASSAPGSTNASALSGLMHVGLKASQRTPTLLCPPPTCLDILMLYHEVGAADHDEQSLRQEASEWLS